MPLRADGLNQTLLEWLTVEPLAGRQGLDVGTGWGRLALALAPRCRRIVGLDRNPDRIAEAKRRATAAGLGNAEFAVVDVETSEYTPWAPDFIVAHLCMSDAIVERASRALGSGALFAFVAFHADQWRETGRRSRFAYDEGQMQALLSRWDFAIDHLTVDHEVQTFGSVEAALAAVVALEEQWRADGRWVRYLEFLEDGGRTLTRSHLVVKARRR